MHGLKHRWIVSFRIEIGGWRDANRPGDGWTQIGKDVTKQIRANDYIEPVRVQHKVRGENIDVIFVGSYFGVEFADLFYALVPEGHSDSDAIRLCSGGQVTFWSLVSQREGERAIRKISEFLVEVLPRAETQRREASR